MLTRYGITIHRNENEHRIFFWNFKTITRWIQTKQLLQRCITDISLPLRVMYHLSERHNCLDYVAGSNKFNVSDKKTYFRLPVQSLVYFYKNTIKKSEEFCSRSSETSSQSWGASSPLCFQNIVKCNMRQKQLYYCIKYLIIHTNNYMFRPWT
jgi:hypothetical protein